MEETDEEWRTTMREMTIEDIKAEQDEFRARPFVSPDAERIHEEWKNYLPTTFPTRSLGHTCNECEPCRCSFEFPRGAIFACWTGQVIEDSRKAVVRILGEIDNEDVPGGTWIVARVLASDAPASCGQMIFFAPTSIKACCMERVDKELTQQ